MGGSLDFREIDISNDPATMVKYGVQTTPTIVVVDRTGKTTNTLVGVPGRTQLKSALEKVTSE